MKKGLVLLISVLLVLMGIAVATVSFQLLRQAKPEPTLTLPPLPVVPTATPTNIPTSVPTPTPTPEPGVIIQVRELERPAELTPLPNTFVLDGVWTAEDLLEFLQSEEGKEALRAVGIDPERFIPQTVDTLVLSHSLRMLAWVEGNAVPGVMVHPGTEVWRVVLTDPTTEETIVLLVNPRCANPLLSKLRPPAPLPTPGPGLGVLKIVKLKNDGAGWYYASGTTVRIESKGRRGVFVDEWAVTGEGGSVVFWVPLSIYTVSEMVPEGYENVSGYIEWPEVEVYEGVTEEVVFSNRLVKIAPPTKTPAPTTTSVPPTSTASPVPMETSTTVPTATDTPPCWLPTPTPTSPPTATRTCVPTGTPTSPPPPTSTPEVPTSTPTGPPPTPTWTPTSPPPTATCTPPPPTATPTCPPPTETPETPTGTPPPPTSTPTSPPPTSTWTPTSPPTSTPTQTPVPTPTPTGPPTSTPEQPTTTPAPTMTPQPPPSTATYTPAPTQTVVPTATDIPPTATQIPSPEPTTTPVPSNTPRPTATP